MGCTRSKDGTSGPGNGPCAQLKRHRYRKVPDPAKVWCKGTGQKEWARELSVQDKGLVVLEQSTAFYILFATKTDTLLSGFCVILLLLGLLLILPVFLRLLLLLLLFSCPSFTPPFTCFRSGSGNTSIRLTREPTLHYNTVLYCNVLYVIVLSFTLLHLIFRFTLIFYLILFCFALL